MGNLKTDVKVLVFDLEILADPDQLMKKYFGSYPAFAMGADISKVISFGYKVMGEMDHAISLNVWDKDIKTEKKLLRMAYDIIQDSDCIVTFYGTKFDKRFLQARMAKYGMHIDTKIYHIDMYNIIKRNFKFSRNRLNDCLEYFDLPLKLDHEGQALWYKVYKHDHEAEQRMSDYCANDVETLSLLFDKLKPYTKALLHIQDTKQRNCPTCGNTSMESHGIRISAGRRYRRLRCRNCASFSREAVKNPNILLQ